MKKHFKFQPLKSWWGGLKHLFEKFTFFNKFKDRIKRIFEPSGRGTCSLQQPTDFLGFPKDSQQSPTIKILVAYHKPAPLIQNDIYTPIHVGRMICQLPSKDGELSQNDLKWLTSNMIGDNTGDHISHLNRYFCELTAHYWAWKNYNTLGNPEYIGFSHYRRVLPYDFSNLNDDTDIYTLCIKWNGSTNGKSCEQHDILEHIVYNFQTTQPDMYRIGQAYLASDRGYYCNMFVMKKELFFDFCKWIFPILMQNGNFEPRGVGYIAERLTGIWITYQKQQGKIIKELWKIDIKNTNESLKELSEHHIPFIPLDSMS